MKKLVGVYSVLLGISIMGLWTMLLTTGNVPELDTEPICLYFHLTAEILMGILLVLSGIGLIKKSRWGKSLFVLSTGMVIYSVINAAGYYANNSEWTMVIMFMVILVLSILFTLVQFKDYL
ncbi:hypothetical protein [Vallitalea okinawensis]|uniref:hypothetical protein n=1 Tax=Vallitalea okinawensis TaxID=2078660 RepID=UPI000CFC2F99|nr:hypothetical protein [Vallitalea okinawensis]